MQYTRTNSKGIASLNINLIPGTYTCIVKYLGDSTYNPITREVLVRVITNNPSGTEHKRSEDYFEVNKVRLYIVMSSGLVLKLGRTLKKHNYYKDNTTHNSQPSILIQVMMVMNLKLQHISVNLIFIMVNKSCLTKWLE